jgi:drug/metabolite transporter (DMT)-like permease
VASASVSEAKHRDTAAWLRLMLVAFAANGLGPFGLKVLTERGLAAHRSQYLLYWYLGGLLFAVAALVLSRTRVSGREILIGALMGACSLGGQSFTAISLANGVPGHVAFPLTTGGSLFVVAIAGIALFRERVGIYGVCGIALGIISLVILSIA